MRSSLYALITLATAMSLGLGACTGGGQADTSQSPAANGSPADSGTASTASKEDKAKESAKAELQKAPEYLVKKDVTTWALPTDNYMRFDFLRFQQGQQVALKQCLADKQIAIEVPPVTYDPAQSQQILANLKALAVFTPEYAQAHGYRPPVITEGNRAYQEFMSTFANNGDINQTLAISNCIIEQPKQYPFLNPLPPTGEGSEKAGQSENPKQIQESGLVDDTNMMMITLKKPEVQEAAAKWRECMAPLGIEDLPQTAQLMPPISKAVGWYSTGLPLGGEPVDEERQVATHDAQCRASTKYTEVVYNALYDAYAEDLQTNQERYVERQKLMKQCEDELKQFIAEHE